MLTERSGGEGSPDLWVPVLDPTPGLIRSEELAAFKAHPETVREIEKAMTPTELLKLSQLPQARAIAPYEYFSFEDLFRDRDQIRMLKLLPVKSDHMRTFYKSQDKDALFARVVSYLGNSKMALVQNAFKDWLPVDVGQFLIWIKDFSVPEQEVVEFIAKCRESMGLGANDLILFERSMHTSQHLVRGTFPQMRHIHFWVRSSGKT